MWEFVQITAQYSNAVLIAVLPHVSDFAQRVNLPIPTPVTTIQVVAFKCDPRKGQAGGVITLSNRSEFTFLDGRVCVYRSPDSYFSLQDPNLIPKFYGPVKVKEKKALQIVHEAIKKLGYPAGVFHENELPQVTSPERIGTNFISRYRFRWLDPNWPGVKNTGRMVIPAVLDVEVNASNGQIEMVCISSKDTRRPSPKVDVAPPLLQTNSKPREQQPTNQVVWPTKVFAETFLNTILPQISDFITKANLPIPIPITTNDVDTTRYTCVMEQGQPIAQLYLKNGDRFNYGHGSVVAFYEHDAYLKFPNMGRLEDFAGRINMSTNEAIALCTRALKNLGFKGTLPKPDVDPPTHLGSKEFTRSFFYWRRPRQDAEFASFEIDMERKRIMSVYLNDSVFWREPPKVDVPTGVKE